MSQFDTASAVEEVTWTMRLADWTRSLDRAQVMKLANGDPPYTLEEEERNHININVNSLTLTRLAHDARQQLSQGILKPGNFFRASTDMGNVHKRTEYGAIVTREVNRIMKKDMAYYENLRCKVAQNVMFGIGPSGWETQDHWCPEPYHVGDILMPTNTRLTFRNLPFFASYRNYTAGELWRLTRGPKNPGWNMPFVERAIKWADQETAKLSSSNYADNWSPERLESLVKQGGMINYGDRAATIDCFDFYFWNEEGNEAGWSRRIILDAWGGYSQWFGPKGYGATKTMPNKNLLGDPLGKESQFLFDSGKRKYGDKLSQLIHFQFADLSASPFYYHEIRSLGWLTYAVCHLQNRLQCAFSKAVFENLMMYMRVKSLDDTERSLKIELGDHAFIDESVSFLSAAERWQPNANLAELGMGMYDRIITENSSSYVQNNNLSRDRVEKTKFQVMAEINAMQTLISVALQQAYKYQTAEYTEIFRRFLKKNSADPDVRNFRARCLTRGVPEKVLIYEAWDIEPERVWGAGNKTMEMAISQQLMEWRGAFSPHAQQIILRRATLALLDDAAEADMLVPIDPMISDSRHDAMLAFGSLMAGALVEFTPDQNRIDVAETLIAELAVTLKRVSSMGPMALNADKLIGFQNVITHLTQLVEQIAGDKTNAPRAKQMAKVIGGFSVQIKKLAQTFAQEQQQKQGGNGDAAKEQAKIAAMIMTAKAKAANTRESHAARTAQRQAQWELEQQQKEQEHAQELRHKAQEQALDAAATDLKTASEIRRNRLRSLDD